MHDMMMKRFLLFAAAWLGGLVLADAQDLITTRFGEEIEARVVEIREGEVTYKMYKDLDGPTFLLAKGDILLIRFENGETKTFTDDTYYNAADPDAIRPGMKFREYKDLYYAGNYVRQPGDQYSAGWLGVASFVIPGLGQAVAGEWGRALGFAGGNVLMNILIQNQLEEGDDGKYYYNPYSAAAALYLAGIALNIWSTCDAVRVAKIKNMYYQDLRQQRAAMDWKIEPFFAAAPKSAADPAARTTPTAGLSLRITF